MGQPSQQHVNSSNSGQGTASAQRFASCCVAADHPDASRAGAGILVAGGNAVDAAIATSFALSVVRPYSCGVGGGGFMVVAGVGGAGRLQGCHALDYREVAPQMMHERFFAGVADPAASLRGGLSVCVPGHVAGMVSAWERWGSLPWRTLLEPSIALAKEGLIADAHYEASAKEVSAWIGKEPQRATRFAWAWERLLGRGAARAGDRIDLSAQARLLERVACDGRAGFYEGDVARAMLDAVTRDGGILTHADLAGYRVIERVPLRVQQQWGRWRTGKSFELLSMPPPSSGGIVLAQVMSILGERWHDVERCAAGGELGPDMVHLVSEALKHAFADRARWMGDPDFVEVPLAQLLDSTRLRHAAAMIDMTRTREASAYGVAPMPREDAGTSHFCVVDGWGNAVACTETINFEFGSLVGVEEFGFCLNDTIDDFATRPHEPNAFGLLQSQRNAPTPGKRPLSAMAPTILRDAHGVLAVAGASGGPRIITSTMQALLHCLIYGREPGDALLQPRFHHQWMPDVLQLESPLLASPLASSLRSKGHEVGLRALIGAVQLIVRAETPDKEPARTTREWAWEAACDPRKGGAPAGL